MTKKLRSDFWGVVKIIDKIKETMGIPNDVVGASTPSPEELDDLFSTTQLQGLKGHTYLESGYVFAPYVPLQISSVLPRFSSRGTWIAAETPVYRKTDCLVVGEMYRVDMPRLNRTSLYKNTRRAKDDNIGFVSHDQHVMYLGCEDFVITSDGEELRMSEDRWFYKIFADDQVGYVYGPYMRLVFLKVELRDKKNNDNDTTIIW